MNLAKSVLAALFVGEVGYFVGIVLAAAKNFGVRTDTAIGIGAWASLAGSWIAICTGLLCFGLALWIFLRS